MNKILHMLGMCQVSGNIVYGEKLIKYITTNKVHLVLLAQDSAINNKKKIINKTTFYNVELVIIYDKQTISKTIGKKNIVAVGIVDKKLAQKIKHELEN